MRAITFAMVFLCAASSVCAGPEAANLRSFHVLVPDYSKTSGGAQPAVSPDGKTIAYKTTHEEVWILRSEKTLAESAEPWRLEIPEIDLSGIKTSSNSYGDGLPRSLDWSPDGKRLAIGGDALLVAESFDYSAKTAAVRVLAKPRLFEGDESAGEMESPRWSPDGEKIVFIRTRVSKPSVVCVVDVETGTETELAQDAGSGADIWNQPWSPDSKYLVYSACSISKGESDGVFENKPKGIFAISVDNKTRRKLLADDNMHRPDWCTKSNQIALVTTRSYEVKGLSDSELSGTHSVVLVTDSKGSVPKTMYQPALPTPKQADEYKAYCDDVQIKKLRAAFKKEFGQIIPPAMTQRLESNKLSEDEMLDFAALTAAKELDDSFLKLLKSKAKGPSGLAAALYDPEVQAALEALPEDKAERFGMRLAGWYIDGLSFSQIPVAESDSRPVWSPDGSNFALIRDTPGGSNQALVVINVSTKESHQIFTTYHIDCVSWIPDGKSLVVQATRLMGQTIDAHTQCDSPGYPEIWLLEPKLP